MHRDFSIHIKRAYTQRTLTFGGRITALLASSFTNLDSTASLHTDNHIFSFLAKINLVKLETSCKTDFYPYGVCYLALKSVFVWDLKVVVLFNCNCKFSPKYLIK